MPRYILVGTSSALPGREDDYNAWYDEVHLKDLLAIPGVESARRFEACDASPTEPTSRYLAIYEIETDDVSAVMDELYARIKSGRMQMTDAGDRSASRLWIWQER